MLLSGMCMWAGRGQGEVNVVPVVSVSQSGSGFLCSDSWGQGVCVVAARSGGVSETVPTGSSHCHPLGRWRQRGLHLRIFQQLEHQDPTHQEVTSPSGHSMFSSAPSQGVFSLLCAGCCSLCSLGFSQFTQAGGSEHKYVVSFFPGWCCGGGGKL